jgi:hypothetical protein
LKLIVILMGLPKGLYKIWLLPMRMGQSCHNVHESHKNWSLRKSHILGTKNVYLQALVDPYTIWLLQLQKIWSYEKFCATTRQKLPSFLILVCDKAAEFIVRRYVSYSENLNLSIKIQRNKGKQCY